ncbi:MAG: histidine kinase [Bacteroidota bacterium]
MILYVFLCVSARCCFGQMHRFENYTTAQGLLSNETYNMLQDRKGYIWINTAFGAQKFNGTEFRQVLVNLPPGETFMYCMYEMPNGRLWAANSSAHVYEIKNDSVFRVKGFDTVSALLKRSVSEVYQLHVDDSLNICLITKRYCFMLQRKQTGYGVIQLNNCIPDSTVAYQVFEKQGQLLASGNIAHHPHLDVTLKKEFIKIQIGDQRYQVKSMTMEGPRFFKKFNRSIYFRFDKKVVKISPEGKVTDLPVNSKIMCFTMDKRGHLWIGCQNDGLYEIDTKDSVIGHYLDNIAVNDVLVDFQGGVWASTYGEGVFHCADLNTLHFKESDRLGKPIAFMKEIDQHLIIADKKGDIFSLTKDSIQSLKTHLVPNEPTDFIMINKDFYLSYRDRLEKLKQSGRSGLVVAKSYRYARELHALNNDSIICLQRTGLAYIVKGNAASRFETHLKMFTYERWNNTEYLGTEDGVYLHKQGRINQPLFLASTKGFVINKAVPDPLGRLWFSSEGAGLFLLDRSCNIKQITTANGLPSDIIYQVSFTSDNRILLSTQLGLFVSDYSGDISKLSWKNLYSEPVKDAILFNGKIYFYSNNRLAIIDPYQLENPLVYHLNFARVFINSVETDSTRLRSLKHNENNIEFDLDLISFENMKPAIFYSLRGPTADSGLTTVHDLKFMNLAPGHYTLLVVPQVDGGQKLMIAVPFFIAPAFYQTTAFKVSAFVFILALVTLLVWLLFRNKKRRQDKINEAQRLILEYKLIALKAQINPHFMSNCLASIQNLILQNKMLQATDYISKFGLLVRKILNYSTRSLITVKEELEIAGLYLDLEKMRFQDKFDYRTDVETGIDVDTCFVPALILNPILENAIWHGMASLTPDQRGEVILNVTRTGETILLSVTDNGQGISNSAKGYGNTRESKGIHLTEQRLRNINFLYGINSAALTYGPAFEKNGRPMGTKALISLPTNLTPLHNE